MEYSGILQMFEGYDLSDLEETEFDPYGLSHPEETKFDPSSSLDKDDSHGSHESQTDSDSISSWDPAEDDAFYNDGLHEMTKEEERLYFDQVEKSGGFDVPELPDVFACGLIQPISISDKGVNRAALEAVNEYNRRYDKDNKGLKFVKVLKATCKPVAFWVYYVTFEAVDMADEGKTKVYQAMVWENVTHDLVVVSFRLKPIEDGGNEGNEWFWEGYKGPDYEDA